MSEVNMAPVSRAIPILMIGLNHKVAQVEVRERLAFGPEAIPTALHELLGEEKTERRCIREAVLLSTCNRTEVYVHAREPELISKGMQSQSLRGAELQDAESRLQTFLARHAGMTEEDLRRVVYRFHGKEAAHHLMQVAAGLDSLILGENEILGQVRTAAEIAQSAGATGPLLAALFRFAIQTGKRVRNETEIGRANLSIAGVVVEMAQELLGPLQDRTALLIGAGKISSTTARALRKAGLRCILIANRTYERAQKLAQSLNGVAVHFDSLDRSLPQADIIICSTGAPHIVLHGDAVQKAQKARHNRPLLIADLAVPRDADPQIAALEGVRLTNIDDLEILAKTCSPLAAAVCQEAETIVSQELEEFCRWYDARRFAPLFEALYQKAENISQTEVEQTLRRLGALTPQQKRQVQALGQSIVGKLLHDPMARLRQIPADQDPSVYIEILQELYGI